jgi:hypothetical protein
MATVERDKKLESLRKLVTAINRPLCCDHASQLLGGILELELDLGKDKSDVKEIINRIHDRRFKRAALCVVSIG